MARERRPGHGGRLKGVTKRGRRPGTKNKQSFVHDGIEVVVSECHCGALPTDEEVRRLIDDYSISLRPICVLCQKTFKMRLWIDHGRKGWTLGREFMIEEDALKVVAMTEQGRCAGDLNEPRIHRMCLAKAIPRLRLPGKDRTMSNF